MARRYNSTSAEAPPEIKWAETLGQALTLPGRRGETYIRGHDYSYLNNLRLFLQGVNEPTTSFNGWKALGRHVKKGAKGYRIIRPITVKSKDELDEQGKPKQFLKFKEVAGAFKYSDTEGEDLPEELTTPPEWTAERAMGVLGISLVKFEDLSLNKQGYSFDRSIAINPTAVYPLKTTWHEMAHIEAGHTVQSYEEYEKHRGLWEFEAEGTAYLGMHELGLDDQMNAAESRHYMQTWLGEETPPDSSIRKVFKLTDIILKAGSEEQTDSAAIAS